MTIKDLRDGSLVALVMVMKKQDDLLSASMLIGSKAFQLLQSPIFVKKWQELAMSSYGFTFFQEAPFVTSWYEVYQHEFEPIVCFTHNEQQELTGLICLARHRTQHFLTHAGYIDAEYHGWLARQNHTTFFLSKVMELVEQQLQIPQWIWNWLPPGLSTQFFKNLAFKNIQIITRPAPIWALTKIEKLKKTKKKSKVKNKIKKLQQLGNYRFEVLKDNKQILHLLTTVQAQCDFRQEAAYNIRPFADHPKKMAFCSKLLQHDSVHACALWLDNTLLAFHLGMSDGYNLCMCIPSYNPTYSKFSPGTLLLLHLAESLTEAGFQVLDLTPGTDAYKARYATNYQSISRITIYFDTKARIKGFLRCASAEYIRTLLRKSGINIAAIARAKKHIFHLPKRITKIKKQHLKAYFKPKKYQLLTLDELTLNNSPANIERQQYQDLLLYDGTGVYLDRKALLQVASDRFLESAIVFTVSHKTQLLWMIWLYIPTAKKAKFHHFKDNLRKGVPILHDAYVAKKGDYDYYLQQTLAFLKAAGHSEIYICQ